jgi:hypothetical protein
MAKKSQTPTRTPPAKASAATNAGGKKAAAKKSAPAAPAAPLIDTGRAANAAAAMIGNKMPAAGAAGAAPRKESSTFKNLKAGLNKPSSSALGGVFGAAPQQKKSHQPFGGGKQIGHNQTFGSDATRTGVPRRTPG